MDIYIQICLSAWLVCSVITAAVLTRDHLAGLHMTGGILFSIMWSINPITALFSASDFLMNDVLDYVTTKFRKIFSIDTNQTFI